MQKRYVLEGEWSGYRSSQRRVAHREVTKYPKRYGTLKTIRYTDGTTLDLSLRPCKPREKVVQILGYCELIEKAVAKNKSFVTVEEVN